MNAICVSTISDHILKPLDPPAYIAKLVYTGKGIIEENKFPVEDFSLEEKDGFFKLVSINEYKFNRADVIKVSGYWEIDGSGVRNEILTLKDDGLQRIEPIRDPEKEKATTWRHCIEDYVYKRIVDVINNHEGVDEHMSKHLHTVCRDKRV